MRVTSPLSGGSEGFWFSCEGITLRLGMLSGSINTGSYNNASSVSARVWRSILQDGRSATKMRILHSILWTHLSARHVHARDSRTPKLLPRVGYLVSMGKRIRVRSVLEPTHPTSITSKIRPHIKSTFTLE